MLQTKQQYSFLPLFGHGLCDRRAGGFESHEMGPNKNGPLARTVSNSVVGDEGCPRAAGAARVPLRRSAPRVLRWKTLTRFLSSAPWRASIPCAGPKKERLPLLGAYQIGGGR